MDPLEVVSLDGSDKFIYISTLLSQEEKAWLRQVIQFNADVFAWTHANMPGISPVHATHKLNIAPSANPVRQKVRRFHPNLHLVIQTEVDNLLHNGFIRSVKHPEWLANVVVPKKGEQMERMCRLHRPQRRLSKRQLPPASHRSDCGCLDRAWHVILFGRFLGISPNPYAPTGCREDIFHHASQTVLL